jgi:hypothetical protein
MKLKNYTLEVLVNNRPVQEFPHEGSTFIEGRKSSSFVMEFHNHTAGRVLVVPSVDGVSTLNGKPADSESPGYVVKAYGNLSIHGWTVDGDNAAEFVFQDKERGYSRSVTGSSANTGVLGVLVYKEKPAPLPTYVDRPVFVPYPVTPINPFPIKPYGGPIWTTGNPPYYTNGIGVCNVMGGAGGDLSLGNVSGLTSVKGMAASETTTFGASDSSDSSARRISSSISTNATASLNATASSTPFELGIGWGNKVGMKTNQVTFDRGELDAQLVLFYDSRRNLEKRGIEVVKREPTVAPLPQAFPGMGCKPPPGWNG